MQKITTKIKDWVLVPRILAFMNGKAVAAGEDCNLLCNAKLQVVHLPTDDYLEYGPVKFYGKTLEEIEKESARLCDKMW